MSANALGPATYPGVLLAASLAMAGGSVSVAAVYVDGAVTELGPGGRRRRNRLSRRVRRPASPWT